MVRTPRRDAPGRVHHVFNRAARKQVLFADRRDFRFFELLLACAVRRGELEIHAYCLLSTHFHLLASSPDGRISYTMMRIQNAYARYRNRRRGLDGPVFRGRFGSRPVLSKRYHVLLHRYIAYNATQAGLCRSPFDYPYGSARQFLGPRASPWFDRERVARALGWRDAPDAEALANRYAALLRTPLSEGESAVVESRMASPRQAEDALDDLFRAPPPALARWMADKIRLEGGRSPWTPMASVAAVQGAVRSLAATHGAWRIRPERRAQDGWRVLLAGMLHTLAGRTTDATGEIAGCHGSTAARRVRLHRRLMAEDAAYARRAGLVARTAIDATFPRDADGADGAAPRSGRRGTDRSRA